MIQDYVENSFSTDQLNTFIDAAEQRIYNMVQLPDLRKNVTGTITANNKYLNCPNDFLSAFSLAITDSSGNYVFLLDKDVSFLREAYPKATSTGTPRFYALFGPRSDNEKLLSLMLAPTPNTDYTAELHYYYYPESIVTAGATWLGENFDSVLLYGCILEAYTFMKGEPEMIANYTKRYDDALNMLKMLGDGKNRQDSYRSGQVRYPVQ